MKSISNKLILISPIQEDEFLPYPEDEEGEFEVAQKPVRVIEDPSPVNKVEPIPEGISFFLFAQVK